MDINDIRGLLTLLLMIGFTGLAFWVFHPRYKKHFEEAGKHIIEDDLTINKQAEK